VILCASWGAVSIVQQHGAWTTTQYRDFGAAVNRLADAGDLVVSPEMIAQEHFYIKAYTKEGVRTARALDTVIECWRAGEVTAERIYFLLPADVAPRYPELAAHLARVATRVDGFHGAVWQLR